MKNVLSVGYNFQGDNISFGSLFSGWIQCMTTCAWMLMSYYSKAIAASDDIGLSIYLDGVEASIGKPGIAEWCKRKYKWITGKTSLWWLVQKHGIEERLWSKGVKGEAVFCDGTMTYPVLSALVEYHPVMIGTKKLGGLPGGHIILVVGKIGDSLICHDPAGNATTHYKNRDGAFVNYPIDFLKPSTGEFLTALRWRPL